MLVDPRLVDNFQRPLVTQATSLSGDIRSILDVPDIDDRTKVTMYQQALSKYLNSHHRLTDEHAAPIKVETVAKETEEFDENNILTSLPQPSCTDAEELLKLIKEHTSLGWDQKGRLLRDGSAVEGSQISESVENLVKKNKKRKTEPIGWNVFSAALKNVWPPQTVEQILPPPTAQQQSRKTTRKQKRKNRWESY